MARRPIGLALLVTLSALGGGGCRLRCGESGLRLDERGPTDFKIGGKNYHVEKSYYVLPASPLTFVMEWDCRLPECKRKDELPKETAAKIARPLYWHALLSGEANRTLVSKMGDGEREKLKRLRILVKYRLKGKAARSTMDYQADELRYPLREVWKVGEDEYRIGDVGMILAVGTPPYVLLTMSWEAPYLCDRVTKLSEGEARRLARPVMREAVSRKLHLSVPEKAAKETSRNGVEVDRIGVAITCRTPEGAHGYRVAAPLKEFMVPARP